MTRARANPVALTSLLTLLLVAWSPAHAQDKLARSEGAGPTRAEVKADLALWKRAGVDRYETEASYGFNTEAYKRAYQEYLRLRASEEFLAEVKKAAAEE
ncbi:hypothetical protein CKO37_00135 [Rubrivivax gelatinosus]|nr:hypothetical protein [Rubrivivax gelatinosus]